jgi:glycosyltransferase involved in cell wall biosynthesis
VRVLFDLSPASFYPGGIGVYTHQLAAARQHFAAAGVELLPTDLPPWMRPDGRKGLAHKYRVAAWDSYYMQAVLPARARAAGAELLHAPGFRAPVWPSMPQVVTILDASPLRFPGLFRRRDVLLLGMYMRRAAQRARHIVTISEHSKGEIMQHLGVAPERITVTYLAAGVAFTPVAAAVVRATLERLNIQAPYILCVGNVEPRKNLMRVIEAFATLRREGRPHTLVLVGKAGALAAPVIAALEQSGVADAVRLTGFVAEDDLAALYTGAAAFVYPSLYEGFGIPPLEAMACGCPVITSNSSSLPEVVGDAALQVDPLDLHAITAALARLLDDPGLGDDLRGRGLARARTFSWRRCAEQTAAAYRRALAAPTAVAERGGGSSDA